MVEKSGAGGVGGAVGGGSWGMEGGRGGVGGYFAGLGVELRFLRSYFLGFVSGYELVKEVLFVTATWMGRSENRCRS